MQAVVSFTDIVIDQPVLPTAGYIFVFKGMSTWIFITTKVGAEDIISTIQRYTHILLTNKMCFSSNWKYSKSEGVKWYGLERVILCHIYKVGLSFNVCLFQWNTWVVWCIYIVRACVRVCVCVCVFQWNTWVMECLWCVCVCVCVCVWLITFFYGLIKIVQTVGLIW